MAVTQNFLIGRTRKSAGGTRFSTWKGLNVIAAKPMQVKQNITEAVELNRAKMAVIGKLVSKMRLFVKVIYSLGIQKTTEFADTVKFFRIRLLDTLKFDITLLTSNSFGTGNATGHVYSFVSSDASTVKINRTDELRNPEFDTDDTDVLIMIIDEDAEFSHQELFVGGGNTNQLIVTVPEGGMTGKKVMVATKCIKQTNTQNLTSKMMFVINTDFVAVG